MLRDEECLGTFDDFHVPSLLMPTETPSTPVDYVPSKLVLPDPRARLVPLEDNEAVIKMTIKQ